MCTYRLIAFTLGVTLVFSGCGWFQSEPLTDLPIPERLRLAILPISLKAPVSKLSTIHTVDHQFSDEEEPQKLATTIRTIEAEARWLLQSRLATRQTFQFVPNDDVDAAIAHVGLEQGAYPTPEDVTQLARTVGADRVLFATIEDYGKVRWQWLLTGMLADMTVDNLIIGAATGWNPIALSASVGWDVLTSAPIWFGGGYFFGVAFRPVRVEARVYDMENGFPIWQATEVDTYAWNELRHLSEPDRKRKQVQLSINLHHAMEALVDSYVGEGRSGW